MHPQTSAAVIRPGVRYFEDGEVTRRFTDLSDRLMRKRAAVYTELAK